MHGCRWLVYGVPLLASATLADAGEAVTRQPADDIYVLREELARQRVAFLEQEKKLERLENRLARMVSVPDGELAASRGAGAGPDAVSPPAGQKPAVPKLPAKPVGKPPPSSAKPRAPELPRLSDTVGGVLTPRHKLVVEPSIEYAYAANNRVFLDAFTFLPAVAVGLIDLRQVQQNTIIGAMTGRYGISDYLEFTARVPYLYRSDSQRSRPVAIGAGVDQTFNAEGYGIGDVELTGRYQINGGSGGWPVFIGNLTTSLPTGRSPYDVAYVTAQGVPGARFPTELPLGTGFYSVQPSITALYPTDPAVFYGSLSYAYNVETSRDIGRVDPGDSLGGSFGLGFSINEKASFSLGYSQKHVFETRINGDPVGGSTLNIGELLLGYAYKVTRDTNINLSIGIGTTPDAQNVKMTLRVPTYFDVM